MSDNTVDPGASTNPNDFLAPLANEGTALAILFYAIAFYVIVVAFKIEYL